MFGILAKFFRFSGKENGNKFKLSMVIGLIEALASAMKIPAIMYILIGLLSGKPTGKYIGGSVAIMVIAIVVDVICKRYSTVLQTEGGYNASAFMRIKIAEHLRICDICRWGISIPIVSGKFLPLQPIQWKYLAMWLREWLC